MVILNVWYRLLKKIKNKQNVAQLGRAPGRGPGGRWFKSSHSDFGEMVQERVTSSSIGRAIPFKGIGSRFKSWEDRSLLPFISLTNLYSGQVGFDPLKVHLSFVT